MAETTAISWTRHTWSPWTGCARVSPACDGCYAAQMMDHRFKRAEWGGPGAGEGTRAEFSVDHWKKPLTWNRRLAEGSIPPFVFPSLCDPFDTAVPDRWRWDFIRLMERTPNLVWLLLTKRIGNAVKLTDPARGQRMLPPNHAIGATFANQDEYDRDRWKLFEAKEALGSTFCFGSFEPMLGPIDFGRSPSQVPDWVIAGGESTQGTHLARPVHPDWLRSLRDQCAARGVPFHFKQWGSCLPGDMSGEDETGGPGYIVEWEHCGVDYDTLGRAIEINAHGREFIRFAPQVDTGRMLDRREHLEFPKYEVRHAVV